MLFGYLPSSLDKWYSELIRKDLFLRVPFIFYNVKSEIRDELIEYLRLMTKFETREAQWRRLQLLEALSWIGDDVVQEKFQKWSNKTPRQLLNLETSLTHLARKAGWEPTTEGKRRDLVLYNSYSLLWRSTQENLVLENSCERCGREMVILFDFDLANQDLSF